MGKSENIATASLAEPLDAAATLAIDKEYRLRPEFVERVLDAIEAGKGESERELVAPLHPADIADLIELAACDEHEGLVKGLAGIVSPNLLAEINDFVREDLLDDIVHIIQDEAGENDLLRSQAGDGDINEPLRRTVRSRLLWLFINLGTEILSVFVMVDRKRQRVRLGLIMLFGVQAIYHHWGLGIVTLVAMILNSLDTGLIPIGLEKLKIDPALVSTIFATTTTDTLGFFFFLGFAALFRLH